MSNLLSVPTIVLLLIWQELTEALHGVNRYRGDTAEIYEFASFYEGKYIVDLCELFSEKNGCEITMDNLSCSEWRDRNPDGFSHSCYVTVKRIST